MLHSCHQGMLLLHTCAIWTADVPYLDDTAQVCQPCQVLVLYVTWWLSLCRNQLMCSQLIQDLLLYFRMLADQVPAIRGQA